MTEKEQRYIEILMEEMNGKFSLVLEGHAALEDKMERFHKEAKEDHHLAMDLIKFSHDELKEDIQGVRTELKETKDELSAKIEAVRTELKDEMAAGFNALGFKVEGHEDRIRFLERKTA